MQSTEKTDILAFGPDISWPKDFLELKLIDDSLRCGICYEYFQTVMVTPCAHSYCSICIRKYLSFKTVCPICFEEVFETSLRNNRILDRLVELFTKIRDKLIKHLKIAAIHFNCNEKSVSSLTPSQSNTTKKIPLPTETPKNSLKSLATKSTSSKGKLNFSTVNTPSTSLKKSQISKRLEDILGSPTANGPTCSRDSDPILPADVADFELNAPTVPSMFLKEPNQTQARSDVPVVSCPVCSVDIPERNINSHLDNCLANVDKPIKSPVKKISKRKPLPKMVWHMMAEKDLRKKLKEYGLNTQGDKKVLITRIQRYIVLYNSECDSESPRSITDIVRQVEREEKQVPQSLQRVITKKTDPKVIEEENNKYIQENKNSFKKLIEAMRDREGRNIKPLRPVNRLSSDEEDDDKNQRKDSERMSGSWTNPQETVNLCDSRSSSPVLDSWAIAGPNVATVAGCSDRVEQLSDHSSSDIFLPETNRELEKTSLKKEDSIQTSVRELDGQDDDLFDAEAVFHSSPSRPLSPSCIVTAHSDSNSEGSMSILIDHNIDAELCDDVKQTSDQCDVGFADEVEPTENPESDADSDFVAGSEDQEQVDSEEVFVPLRKSKRKHQNSVINKVPSPRRTRRRLNK